MVEDAEARKAVRQLMEQLDSIDAQYASLAYVLVRRDPNEYTQLLEAAEKATPKVTQILAVSDDLHRQVYEALDESNADWCKVVLCWLNRQGPIILTRDQGDQIMRLMQWNEPQ